jgi:acetolactate synthase small subunit
VTFVITSVNTGAALPRIVMLFHRLHVEIQALSMVRRERSEATRIFVTTLAKEEKARRIEACLLNLVEVRMVSIQRLRDRKLMNAPPD